MRAKYHTRGAWLLGVVSSLTVFGLLWLGTLSGAGGRARASTNYSLRFYGHGVADIDRVKIPVDPHVPADVGGDFTIEFWMKANLADNVSTPAACDTFLWVHGNIILDRDIWGTPSSAGDYGISLHEGRIRFGMGGGGLEQTVCGATDVADGQWHHIAVTRRSSDGRMRIFVDGSQEQGSSAQKNGPTGDISYPNGWSSGQPNDPYLVIGAEKHDAGGSFPSYNGFVDEVRISNAIRYSGNFTPPAAPFTPDGNTAALYHFDEGPLGACSTGKIILDSSGAAGGPSHGTCQYGGSNPKGPVYSTDTPFNGGGTPSSPTPTFTPSPTPTPTPDTTAPSISNVTHAPFDTLTVIAWDTDEPATSHVLYALSPPPSTTVSGTEYLTSHSILLSGLVSNTTYVYQVRSRDPAGNEATTAEFNFTTLDSTEVSRVYLPVIFRTP